MKNTYFSDSCCLMLFKLYRLNNQGNVNYSTGSTLHYLKHQLAILVIMFACAVGKAQPSEGRASFYSNKFKGRSTASGEKYDPMKLTAAHRTLPFGTCLKITNLANDSSTIVRINDRGPFIKGRIIDVSMAAAQKLNFVLMGTTKVKVEITDTITIKMDTLKSN